MKNKLPSYIADAKAVPKNERAPWYKNIAPAYAGIILWFVFWQDIVNTGTGGGGLAYGTMLPLASLAVAAALSYLLFYAAPALFGMKTGYGLAVLGSSIFGTKGGVFMPGLLMGLLQFGWLSVNIYFASILIRETLTFIPLWAIIVSEGILATFVGLKGIKYVAGISTYLPIIPLAVLAILLFNTAGTIDSFNPQILSLSSSGNNPPLGEFGVFAFVTTYVLGFFATAGAAGADFGSNARNARDVNLGGLVGITLAMAAMGGAAIFILAGAYGNPATAQILAGEGNPLNVTKIMGAVLGENTGKICMFLLALSAFPSACFASLIAANAFKTMLPKVDSNLSVSLGGAAAIILALTGVAGNAAGVFSFIGASFGPICGAFLAEYILSKGEWKLASVNFNSAGWVSWLCGFAVGVLPNFGVPLPISPLAAFVAGFALYACLRKKPRR